MKKLTAILSALMLIVAMTPAAFATVYTEGFLHYTISDESITITGYFGDEETVTIPAMIAGIPVNSIASGAFTGSGIKVLNLPDTITSIESGAIDVGVVINYNSNLPSDGQEQPQQGESQSTEPAQPDDSKPQPSQPNQPEQPAGTTSTEPTNAIEEVEAELALEESEVVTTSPTEDIPDSSKGTEAATEPVTEPAESSAPKPIAAVIAVAVLALGGVLVWKKKK